MELAASMACRSIASSSLVSKLLSRKCTNLLPPHSCSSGDSSPLCKVTTETLNTLSISSPFCSCPSIDSKCVSYMGVSRPRHRSASRVCSAAASDASIPFAASDTSPSFHKLVVENEELSSASTSSFLTSQRIKVVALVAFVMALCNADRVIMSVAIVHFSSMYSWSTSFSGVVQVFDYFLHLLQDKRKC
ncbi:hypothetical protein L7F22_042315 [Adiantum nelumboides]|nr:hypothetical protein [Adiantum nelumboides]